MNDYMSDAYRYAMMGNSVGHTTATAAAVLQQMRPYVRPGYIWYDEAEEFPTTPIPLPKKQLFHEYIWEKYGRKDEATQV